MDISGEFWTRFDSCAGPAFGTALLCVGLFLMFKGATKIKIFSFLTGCAIGQLSSTFLYDEIGSLTSFSEGDFTLAATFACGVVMFMAVGLMSLAVTGYISLQTMLWIVSMLEANGYDVGTELIGGILVGVSFLINRYMRKNLYLFGSAALGSLMVIYGYLVMNGEIPSEISIMDPSVQLIGLALFLNSVMIQRRMVKEKAAHKLDAELQKEIDKRQRIENDQHGRGRYLEPDILTQAAIEERLALVMDTSYKRTDSYNLNQRNRFN